MLSATVPAERDCGMREHGWAITASGVGTRAGDCVVDATDGREQTRWGCVMSEGEGGNERACCVDRGDLGELGCAQSG